MKIVYQRSTENNGKDLTKKNVQEMLWINEYRSTMTTKWTFRNVDRFSFSSSFGDFILFSFLRHHTNYKLIHSYLIYLMRALCIVGAFKITVFYIHSLLCYQHALSLVEAKIRITQYCRMCSPHSTVTLCHRRVVNDSGKS